MAGWLGRTGTLGTIGPENYFSTDRVLTNLLVARSTGNSDTGAKFYLLSDSNYLATCGAVVNDWYVPGGHSIGIPDETKSNALVWILSQRVPSAAADRGNAATLFNSWQNRIFAGDRQSVLYECVSNLVNRPRNWYSYQAQLIFDQLATNSTSFLSLNVSNLADGDFAADLFYYYARSAATNNDRQRYYSALKALTGITGASGDRTGDINILLTQSGYLPPRLQPPALQAPGQLKLRLIKDTPGLVYSVETRSNFVNDAWQDFPVSQSDTNTVWSTDIDLPPGSPGGYFRLNTTPAPGISPDWPL
jgi:hypothetical protein